MQELADDMARRIAEARATAALGKPGRVHLHLDAAPSAVDDLVQRAASLGGDFIRLPIPPSASGVYGEFDGVIVRAMPDYRFENDRVIPRIDVATASHPNVSANLCK